jgi:hypothetical protein
MYNRDKNVSPPFLAMVPATTCVSATYVSGTYVSATYVSAYFRPSVEDPSPYRTEQWRQTHFRQLLDTGIHLVFYTNCPDMVLIAATYPDTCRCTLVDSIPLPSVEALQEGVAYGLPRNRNEKKDTLEYMRIIHAKTVLVGWAAAWNPWSSPSFAWIDMSIFYVFKRPVPTAQWLHLIGSMNTVDSDKVFVPGCWAKGWVYGDAVHDPCWRFCGGFFYGSRDAVLALSRTCQELWPTWIAATKGVWSWEVNFWAWLERCGHFERFHWYDADHNDSMIDNFPLSSYSWNLRNKATCIQPLAPLLPVQPGYRPSSVSHLLTGDNGKEGTHWLLVRYVSYTIDPVSGCFHVDPASGFSNLSSLNYLVACWIDGDGISLVDGSGKWLDTQSLKALQGNVDGDKAMSRGLEDVRLFPDHTPRSAATPEAEGDPRRGLWGKELPNGLGTRVRIMGCTVDLTEHGTPNCFVGGLDLSTGVVDDVCVMTSRHTQKNWVPVPKRSDSSPSSDEIPYIHGWSRFNIQWGLMRPVWSTGMDGQAPLWEITERTDNRWPFLHQAKGSSCFVPYGSEGSMHIGVVHATQEAEGSALRQYWHFFVVMDFERKEVVRVSRPWTLCAAGVQYCIGYWFSEGVHHVWGSELDRDPVYMRVSEEAVEWA